MPDPIDPDVPAALTNEPQSDTLAPTEGRDAVRKMTHEVDTDDMFGPGT